MQTFDEWGKEMQKVFDKRPRCSESNSITWRRYRSLTGVPFYADMPKTIDSDYYFVVTRGSVCKIKGRDALIEYINSRKLKPVISEGAEANTSSLWDDKDVIVIKGKSVLLKSETKYTV